jgi:hypothetical protein
MEGNFLSRYKNKVEYWTNLIETDPANKRRYEDEMSDYMIRCMPYMNQYADDMEESINTDNVFNVKETVGIQRKDIFTDYLVEVENQNINRPKQRKVEQCESCSSSNVIHIQDTSELVCDSCGLVLACLISEELTYREEQETSEKIVNYSYKRENHFNEWLSQFQAQEMTTIPDEVMEQLRILMKLPTPRFVDFSRS